MQRKTGPPPPDTEVMEEYACPKCGERRVGWLGFDDDDQIVCRTCGTHYPIVDPIRPTEHGIDIILPLRGPGYSVVEERRIVHRLLVKRLTRMGYAARARRDHLITTAPKTVVEGMLRSIFGLDKPAPKGL